MKQTPYSERIKYAGIRSFGGLTNPDRATDGNIVKMENLTSEHYPALSPRTQRRILESIENCHAFGFFDGKLYYVSGTEFYYDGVKMANVEDNDKRILQFPGRLMMLPDKIIIQSTTEYYRVAPGNTAYKVTGYNDNEKIIDVIAVTDTLPEKGEEGQRYITTEAFVLTGERLCLEIWSTQENKWVVEEDPDVYALYRVRSVKAKPIEATYEWRYTRYSDPEIEVSYIDSEDGTIHATLESWTFNDSYRNDNPYEMFEVGDYIRIIGYEDGHNFPALANGGVITEIREEYLCIRISEAPKGAINPHCRPDIYFHRIYPDFDGAFELNNRLWAWKGSTIYASALGEPDKIFDYSLSSTSPWTVDTAGEKICAGIAYDGYPIFFKKNSIIKVYGSEPSEFSTRELECAGMGVDEASRDSLAVCAGHLIYNSPKGIMKYSGGYPSYIGDGISHLIKRGGLGASDGRRYYLSFSGKETFVYDSLFGLWHREDNGYGYFYMHGASLIGVKDGKVELISGDVPEELKATGEEELITSSAELAYITEGALLRKTYNRIRARLQVFTGKLEILASYDDSEPEEVMSVKADKSPDREVRCVDLLVRRCDSLKLYVRGTGDYRIYSIDREFTVDNDEI